MFLMLNGNMNIKNRIFIPQKNVVCKTDEFNQKTVTRLNEKGTLLDSKTLI